MNCLLLENSLPVIPPSASNDDVILLFFLCAAAASSSAYSYSSLSAASSLFVYGYDVVEPHFCPGILSVLQRQSVCARLFFNREHFSVQFRIDLCCYYCSMWGGTLGRGWCPFAITQYPFNLH